ncbi:MAG TPA: HlyD family efflux transporter periplasmic adaptor subunit, partial [Micromonosporaceae bacterium]
PARIATIGIGAFVIVALAVSGVFALRGKATAAPHTTVTATVRRGTVTVTASAAGTIESINERALTFGAGGTVATLKVKAGQSVIDGQVLATLDPTDAQDAVNAAQSALDAANTNLALAEQQAASPSPTATGTCVAAQADFAGVATGAAIAVADAKGPQASKSPSPSPSPSSSPSASPSPSRTGSPTPTRTPAPHPSRSATGCTGRTGGSGTGSGSGNAQSQGGGTDNLLHAQQTVHNDELALDQAESALTGTTIIAPIAGRVLSVAGAVGDTVSAGGSGFIVLGGASSLAVEASFSEADVAPIKVGQNAAVSLATHPGITYAAKVSQIDPAGTTSGSLVKYGVQLVFTSVPPDLLIGQSADVAVTTASVSDALYVPAAAISTGPGGTSQVTVHTGSGNATRTVTVGLDGDQGTEITSGLTAGETVVIG